MSFGEELKSQDADGQVAAILNAVSDAILTTDHRAIIQYANHAVTSLFGYEQDEIIGQSVKVLLGDDAAGQHDGSLDRFQELTGVPRELVVRTKHGEERHIELILDPMPGEGPPRFVALLRDLSTRDESRRLLEERAKLAANEQRFRDFAECGAYWFWEIDADYRFTYLSPQVETATGYSPEWHLGHTREELGLDAENVELMDNLYQEVDEEKEFQDRLQVRRRKDGGHVWVAFSGKPLTDEAGNFAGYRGVSRDVTTAIKRENDLRATNAELENFAYAASHDLQEPLRKIMAFSERLTEELGDDLAPGPAMYLSRISASSSRMSTLINNLLEFSRAGRPRDPAVPVNLATVFEQVRADQELAIHRSNAVVHADTLPIVKGHESQFYQLLANLLANALKFRKPDTPAEVSVSCSLTSLFLVIEFRDKGIGFDDGQADRIFELFGRLHGRSTYEGTGLGLAICRKVVEFHNGRIEGRGVPDEGAVFTIRLPRDLVLSLEYPDERVA
jgi:PAS domain S-box-containing protein